MSTITESEKKRLQSLKEKKQAFKAKSQFLQQALRNLDDTTKVKKIIFDDIDEQQSSKLKRKRDLFDSDNDSDNDNEKDSLWNKDEFSIKENKSKKTILGNDARFTLDDRFIKNDDQTEKTELVEDNNECDLQKEKEKQLDILESILGTPLTVKNQEIKTTKKNLMIRYDPTENGHGEYEVKSEQPKMKEKNTKKKRDKFVLEMEPTLSEPEVSKDIYYTVSDILTESLKQKEEFSLLKAHRKENDTENAEDCSTSVMDNKAHNFKLNFNATNAFKYDSSDADEDLNEVLDTDKQMTDEIKENTCTNSLFEYKDTLFLDNEDIRFNEARRFFNAEAISNDEFKNLRRELKMIVRTKIRTNERKHQPWNKKRKIRIFKK
ncbi:nucleolar protein 8-like [Nylanderia fulva]|uniref:nucleolar protein 8-like n=1 Tax=Nylanderia fulva TaxID=613905 RepID=UPI0010FBA678|nr:nucleolar protein 8-like [Nylanderia fulva]